MAGCFLLLWSDNFLCHWFRRGLVGGLDALSGYHSDHLFDGQVLHNFIGGHGVVALGAQRSPVVLLDVLLYTASAEGVPTERGGGFLKQLLTESHTVALTKNSISTGRAALRKDSS